MKYLKKLKTWHYAVIAVVIIVLTIWACMAKEKPISYHFNTIEEAFTECDNQYKEISQIKNTSIKNLSFIINKWTTLRDTTIIMISNDTSTHKKDEYSRQFIKFCHNMQEDIIRLVESETRDMSDYVNLKKLTAYNRRQTLESDYYKQASEIFDTFNKRTYPDTKTIMQKYRELMKNSQNMKTERDLIEFIREEDVCFRSTMEHLKDMQPEQLTEISEMTEPIFHRLQNIVDKNDAEESNKRLLAYLSLRINRRVLQNAQACVKDIEAKVKLDGERAMAYKWMLVQPFLSLDKYTMAYMTDKQCRELEAIAVKLHVYMSYLDGVMVNEKMKKENEHLKEELAKFFIKNYIKDIL